jgi:hypothetical protein
MLKQYFGDKEAFGYTVGGYHVLQMTVPRDGNTPKTTTDAITPIYSNA